MKKALLTIGLALAMTTTAKANVVSIPNGFYPHMGVVTEVKENGDFYEITFSDGVGRVWSWLDDSGDWFKGDFVAVIMYDNATEIVSDDVVVDAHYVGYKELF